MKRDLRELAVAPRRVEEAEPMATLLAGYRRSGLSLRDFARAEGLPIGRLHYWLYQKHRAAGGVPRPGAARPVAPAFQEVKLGDGLARVTSWAAEVNLPTGVAVRFSATALPAWIGAVVQALQRPC